jgi:hypothetical protein
VIVLNIEGRINHNQRKRESKSLPLTTPAIFSIEEAKDGAVSLIDLSL